MDRLLVTHSLLSSWQWALKGNPYEDTTTERDAYADFIGTLKKEPRPATKAMLSGIAFENLITNIIEGKPAKEGAWNDAAAKIARICAGGVLQYKAHKEVEVNGIPLLLYGRLDCLKAGTIYDIKYSTVYDAGRYIGSTQHPTYLELVPEASEFAYLISNGSQVWTETYRRDETLSILPVIGDFLAWLDMQGLMDVYREFWKSK